MKAESQPETLRVRAYNVGFGDAVLVSIPDRDACGRPVRRHILIDVGNVLAGPGGDDEVFVPIVRDVLGQLGGKPLDLYVMTHEHLDHVQGLLRASRRKTPLKVPVGCAWLTASSEPGYYAGHPEAKRRRLAMQDSYSQIERLGVALRAAGKPFPAVVEAMMLNNNWKSTKDCVDYLASLAGSERTAYVSRPRDGQEEWPHPFREAELTVWAPEEDTAVYYGRFRPLTLGVAGGEVAGQPARMVTPAPPDGVDGESFERYLEVRRRGYFDGLLAIDAAANNTSIVLSIKWRGWHLLFPGDAEIRSWKQMAKAGVLEPVDFLKVAHHGSRNGTPAGELLDKILPAEAAGEPPRRALISSHPGTYKDVPSDWTTRTLEERGVEVRSLHAEGVPAGGFIDLEYSARSKSRVEVQRDSEAVVA